MWDLRNELLLLVSSDLRLMIKKGDELYLQSLPSQIEKYKPALSKLGSSCDSLYYVRLVMVA